MCKRERDTCVRFRKSRHGCGRQHEAAFSIRTGGVVALASRSFGFAVEWHSKLICISACRRTKINGAGRVVGGDF